MAKSLLTDEASRDHSTHPTSKILDNGKMRICLRSIFRFLLGRSHWETRQQQKLRNETEEGTTHRLQESYEEEEWAEWEHPHDESSCVESGSRYPYLYGDTAGTTSVYIKVNEKKSHADCNDYVLPVFISVSLKEGASAALSDISSDFGDANVEELDELAFSVACDYSIDSTASSSPFFFS